MPSDVARDEFDHLATRVDVLESEFEGEKTVTRHILEQTRHNTGLLANVLVRIGGLETRADGVDRVEKRLDGVEDRLGGVETGLGRMEAKVDGLTKSLPKIVGDAVREANRDRNRR